MSVDTWVATTYSDDTDNLIDLHWTMSITPPVSIDEPTKRIKVPVASFEYYGRSMDATQVPGIVARDQIQHFYNVGACHGYRLVYAPVGNGIVVVEVDFEAHA